MKVGDRVAVKDEYLARLREIMRSPGSEPEPNHHGVIAEDFGDSWLIHFDDGVGAPYPKGDCEALA